MNNRINIMSVFFSTVYNKAYYITSSLTIALMMEFVTTTNIKVNSTILYWISLAVYIITMVVLYIVCKIIKNKHNILDIRQLDKKYITTRIVIMLAYTMVVTILISIIHILVLIKLVI